VNADRLVTEIYPVSSGRGVGGGVQKDPWESYGWTGEPRLGRGTQDPVLAAALPLSSLQTPV
jgi:hypothetical protein